MRLQVATESNGTWRESDNDVGGTPYWQYAWTDTYMCIPPTLGFHLVQNSDVVLWKRASGTRVMYLECPLQGRFGPITVHLNYLDSNKHWSFPLTESYAALLFAGHTNEYMFNTTPGGMHVPDNVDVKI